MTLLRKSYSPGIEGGGIPDEDVIRKHVKAYYYHKDRQLNDDDILPLKRVRAIVNEIKQTHSEELARLKEENERLRGEGWISVEDRLPIVDKTVLCLFKHGRMDVCKYTKVFEMEFVENAICVTTKITHWQPLPEPPSPTKK